MQTVLHRDLQLRAAAGGRRYAILWVRPLKKQRGQQQPKLPQYFSEQPDELWEPYQALQRLAQAATGEPTGSPTATAERELSLSLARTLKSERDAFF